MKPIGTLLGWADVTAEVKRRRPDVEDAELEVVARTPAGSRSGTWPDLRDDMDGSVDIVLKLVEVQRRHEREFRLDREGNLKRR